MSQIKAERLFERMRKIADPRREHQKFHSLYELLVIAICAVLCGAEHWTEMDELKAKLKQNSQNSNRPPSSDRFNKPKPAFAPAKGKRGGQAGHRGQTLERVATPDFVIDCEPVECVCGQPEWTAAGEMAETRQVFELPEPRLEVVEYRRVKRQCKCGRSARGEFPIKVLAPVQYGEKVQAMVTHLSVQGCLS